jgi:hypothetical protein
MRFAWFNCILFTDEADSLSKEENNFVRLYLLCLKIATTAVRVFFDSKVPGHTLEAFLKQHKSNLTSQYQKCIQYSNICIKMFSFFWQWPFLRTLPHNLFDRWIYCRSFNSNQAVPFYINWHCNKKKLTRKQFRLLVLCTSVRIFEYWIHFWLAF